MFRSLLLLAGSFFSVIFVSGQSSIKDSLLIKHVSALAHDSMEGRFTGTEGMRKAAGYIAEEMKQIGLQPYRKDTSSYIIPWPFEVAKLKGTGWQVAGFLPGIYPDSFLIISAHYDHIGIQSVQKALPFGVARRRVKGDTIYNGANDNATGVAAMLALARSFQKEPQPFYSVLFIAFSGEELGLLGSADFAEKLDAKKVKINVNLEMLGRSKSTGVFITEPEEYSSFRDEVNKTLFEKDKAYRRSYFRRDPFKNESLFKRSDNYSFYKVGIPAFTIMASDPRDRYYHHPDDETDTIDFESMTQIVEAIRIAITPFTQGTF